MQITRENRVKMLQNIGQYLIDNADNLIPNEKPFPTDQTFLIELSVDLEMPHITVTTRYNAVEALKGVEWWPYTPRSGTPSY